MGTPFFAVPILKSLYQNGYPISVVYTQPPQKSQRGQRINKSPVQGISETLNLEFRTPVSLKNNKDEREDLMQRTLMRIWEKIETFDLDGNDEKNWITFRKLSTTRWIDYYSKSFKTIYG